MKGDNRQPVSVPAIKKAFEKNLYHNIGKPALAATPHDFYTALAYTVRSMLLDKYIHSVETYLKKKTRVVAYFSAEFLEGPHLVNNMLNMGVIDQVDRAMRELGLNLDELVKLEVEPGLGNGGLGRLAACFLDGGPGGLGGAVDLDGQLALDLALGQKLDPVAEPLDHAQGPQGLLVDRPRGVQPAVVDGLLQSAQVDRHVRLAEEIVEAALGQAPIKRHLAALETLDGDAAARFLPLLAAARGLARARANASAHALTFLARAGIIGKLVQLHGWPSIAGDRRAASYPLSDR